MTLKEYEEFINSDIQDEKMEILYKRLETFFEEDRDTETSLV